MRRLVRALWAVIVCGVELLSWKVRGGPLWLTLWCVASTAS